LISFETDAARTELERIRKQLTDEIMRVRERRAEQEKQLKLEVEQ